MLFEGLQGVGGALYDLNVPQTIEWVAQKVFSACASAAVFSLLVAIFIFALFAVVGRFYQKNNDMKQSEYGELTKEQFELMKKIRDETLSRTERYSELIKDPDSNEAIFKIIDIDEKKKKKIKNGK
jgi:hypothetical protein